MNEEDPLEELWRVKEELSLRFNSAAELAAYADQMARETPLPRPSKTRKMLEGVPRNVSIADLFPGQSVVDGEKNGHNGTGKHARPNGTHPSRDQRKSKARPAASAKTKPKQRIAKKRASR